MDNYYDLTIASVKPETANAVTMTFEIPQALQPKFRIIPGQQLKLKTTIAGDTVERTYSVCEFSDKHLQIGIKRIDGELFSNFACDHIQDGDLLSVQTPQGGFNLPEDNAITASKRYCFVAAGSGITSSLAMIRQLLEAHKHTQVSLIYINTRRTDIMYFRALDDLKNTYLKRFSLTHVLTGEPGMLDVLSTLPDAKTSKQLINNFIGTQELDYVYLCGPSVITEVFATAFAEIGVKTTHIHIEETYAKAERQGLTPAMAPHEKPYYPLMVSAVEKLMDDAVAITFTIPEKLKKTFKPIAGQHIKLKTKINGEPIERFYSICAYGDDFIQVGIKRFGDGVFSNYACDDNIKAGDILMIQPPQGDFCLPAAEQIAKEERFFFLAAGSGITPTLAMISNLLAQHRHTLIVLIYVNPSRNKVMFFKELDNLKNTYIDRLSVIHVLTREPREIKMLSSRPDEETASQLLDGFVGVNIDHAYLCGPLPFMDLFRNLFIVKGLDTKRIHMELFGTPDSQQVKPPESNISMQTDLQVTLISQGSAQTVSIRPDQNVLDAALQGGLSVPFACKGGVCATCKAKRLGGDANMVLNYGLEDDDVERGMMLTCQTYVTSETATFDYDVQ